MVEILTLVYLVYMFIAMYFIFLFTLTFIQNRREMFHYPKIKNYRSVSVLIPAYNEEDSIKGTIETILKMNYKNIIEIIIINDGSKDKTREISEKLEREYDKVILLNKFNSGKADSLNQAIKIAKGELIAVVDADSYPSEDALDKMVGYFEYEERVGAVTTRILVRNPKTFIQKLQSVEYKIIGFSRKLLGFLDAIYVTPGPLALYKKSALEDIGGFDVNNLTEDIEATWHLAFKDYKIKMSFLPSVTTVSPENFKKWFRQRQRWNMGGYQTMIKYRKNFMKKGMLGFFILPFFSISLLLGVVGLSIFLYRTFINLISSYLSTKYSIVAQTAIIRLQDINLNPSILHFFGVILFVFGFLFIFFSLYIVNQKAYGKEGFGTIIFYSIVYMTLYPIVMMTSLYKFSRGNMSW